MSIEHHQKTININIQQQIKYIMYWINIQLNPMQYISNI